MAPYFNFFEFFDIAANSFFTDHNKVMQPACSADGRLSPQSIPRLSVVNDMDGDDTESQSEDFSVKSFNFIICQSTQTALYGLTLDGAQYDHP